MHSVFSSPRKPHLDKYESTSTLPVHDGRLPTEEVDFRSLSGFSPEPRKVTNKTHAAIYFEETPPLGGLGHNPSRQDLQEGKMKEDTVSPYTIENYSGFRIFVHKLIGERQEKKEGIMSIGQDLVETGDSLDIGIDYEQRIAGELWRNEYDPLCKGDHDDSVRIVIADPEHSYEPIERVSFGSVGFFTHNLKTGKTFVPFGLY